jgi:PAS domain S-box-containing protein
MKEQSDSRLAHHYKTASAAGSMLATAVGISGLAGSAFHIRALVTWGVEPVTMKVNTALCFVLAGVSLWLLREESPTSRGRSAGRFAALVLCVLALLSAVEFFINLDLRLDQLFIRALPDATIPLRQSGLMSPITAFNFLMFAVALLLIDWRTKNRDWPAQYFCMAGALGTSVGILGVFFQPFPTSITVAAPTAVCFVALTCGITCARASWAVGGLLTSESAGAKWMRRAGLSAIVVLILLGWLLSKPLLTSDHLTWMQFTVIVVVTAALLASLIVWTALLLNQTDLERRRAELALRLTPEKLDWFTGRYEDTPLDINIRRWSAAGILLGIALTSFGGYLSWRSVRQATEDANWVAHTQAVLAALESALAHNIDIETGGRGFAATGDERFTEPMVVAWPALVSDLAKLKELTADNASQQQRLLQLRSQTGARLACAEDIVAERRRTGEVPATAAFVKGKQAMDAVRATIAEMQDEESRLLEQRTKRSEAARHHTTTVTLFSTLSGILLLLVAGLVTRREIGDSARMRGQLQTLNAGLERRVEERTSALHESQQRLQGIFDSALDSIIAVDEERRIMLFNEAAQKTFRCSAAQAVGRLIDDFIPERFRGVHADHVRRFADTGVTSRTMGNLAELWALRADGEEFQIEASLSQTGVAGKKIFTVILRDVTEQKAADKAQRALASIVTFSHDAIIGKNLDGTVTSWNPGAEKIYGYSAAEMIGRPITTLIPPDRSDDFGLIMRTIKSGEELRHYECVRIKKDGQPIQVALSVSPMRDQAGKIVGASTIARDITERKQAEKLLRQSEEKYRTLFESIVEGFCVVEVLFDENEKPVDYRFLEISPSFEAQTGLKNARGKRMREMAPLHEERWFELYGRVALTGESVHLENEAAELHRWYEVHASRIGEPSERRVAILFSDITARKLAENALRESEARLEAMVNGIPKLAWMAEPDGHIFWYNRRWFEYTGTTLEQMKGWGWQSVHDPGILPKVLEGWNGAIAAGNPFEMEFPLRGADGRFGIFLTRVLPLKDAAGRIVRWFGTNTDISGMKQAEEKLRANEREIRELNDELEQRVHQRTAQLEAANKELEAFTYSVSHDLRAPLRHISGFSRMLLDEFGSALPSEAHHYLERILGGTRRMGMLVDDLLNLGRIGRQTLQLQVTGLRPIVDELIEELQPECAAREIEWKIGELPFLDCDPGLLKQVLQNLLSNALKFTRPRHRAIIEIGQMEARMEADAGKSDKDTVIYVRDNGVGFSMKYADKLFGVFQRLHRQEDFDGTGVGLATVQRIIQKHGGRIWADAELDKGATFYFTVGKHETNGTKAQSAVAGETS